MPRSNRLEESEVKEPQESSEMDNETSETVISPESDDSKAKRPKPGRSSADSKKSSKEASPKKALSSSRKPAARNSSSTKSRPKRSSRTSISEENPIESVPAPSMQTPRMLQLYRSTVKDALMSEFDYQNVMELPMIKKVVINIGMGEVKTNSRAMESATRDLGLITGQKPVITRAKKSIAGFKLREGEPIGTSVTLRGNRMYEFMDRLLNAALPRIRDFRGVSNKAFDGRGNYSLGINEQVIFPEIDYGQIDRVRGMQISIVTSAKTDLEAMRLLHLMGMPFVRDGANNRGSRG